MVKVHRAAEAQITQIIEARQHRWLADEPPGLGDDQGPDPLELLDAALGACTAMTIQLVARRKQWPLADVRVAVTHERSEGLYRMRREIELVGELSAEQRDYLLGIAGKCPVHKTLSGKIEFETALKA